MAKVQIVVPEAPSPAAADLDVAKRHIDKRGIRLGVLDNSKSNADYLLRFVIDSLKESMPITSVVSLRKASVSLPAPLEMLDQLEKEADLVISAMAD